MDILRSDLNYRINKEIVVMSFQQNKCIVSGQTPVILIRAKYMKITLFVMFIYIVITKILKNQIHNIKNII